MSIPKLLKNNFKVQAQENKFEIEQQGKTNRWKNQVMKNVLSHRNENTRGTHITKDI